MSRDIDDDSEAVRQTEGTGIPDGGGSVGQWYLGRLGSKRTHRPM